MDTAAKRAKGKEPGLPMTVHHRSLAMAKLNKCVLEGRRECVKSTHCHLVLAAALLLCRWWASIGAGVRATAVQERAMAVA